MFGFRLFYFIFFLYGKNPLPRLNLVSNEENGSLSDIGFILALFSACTFPKTHSLTNIHSRIFGRNLPKEKKKHMRLSFTHFSKHGSVQIRT